MSRLVCAALAAALLAVMPLANARAAASASPVGLWRTFDDKTGRPGGLLRIFERYGAYFARIEKSPAPDDDARICSACTDERRNQPLAGLVVMRNMRFEDGQYEGGDILDPRTGSVYRCRFRLEAGGARLVIRGYLGISLLGRSQTWQREG